MMEMISSEKLMAYLYFYSLIQHDCAITSFQVLMVQIKFSNYFTGWVKTALRNTNSNIWFKFWNISHIR
jgi:hypothetical protein